MSKIIVEYTAPITDGSGYARAARANIKALIDAGVEVTLNPISFEEASPDLGEFGKKYIYPNIRRDVIPTHQIIHTTPEFWEKYRKPGIPTINYTIWETTRLHKDWPKYINNNTDVLVVGCEWNVKVFRDSGVTVPIYSLPHPVRIEGLPPKPFDIAGVPDDAFVFYNINQWTERKNPLANIISYWRAFTPEDNVALVLKTYRSDYSEGEKNAIRDTIRRLKKLSPADYHPPIYLILDMLSEDEIDSLHMRGDCYVSLDRGEGFGLSTATAGAFGKPVIATGFGGALEYLKEDNSYLVDYVLEPVRSMPWCPWYRLEQDWAYPSQVHGAELMRKVYDNREEAAEKGRLLKGYIETNLSYEAIGKRFKEIIESVG